ncbi:hypothetical protein FRB94_012211 [Tulasnella sp. JGI-2019a]|nr:hypothetical protein FRB94_012211 [Tulasnella sp. JGI-2019a]KAG9008166.1 hypothetical protein FRB93_006733 [Tulasnella sp. JGI-2019a]
MNTSLFAFRSTCTTGLFNIRKASSLTRHIQPPLTTLIENHQPPEDRLLLFYPRSEKEKIRNFRVDRRVVRDGVNFGHAALMVKHYDWKVEDGELRLCPYFDPTSKTLRFKKPDGEDFHRDQHLTELLSRKIYRPLLHLAHAEGLLDKVPADALTSLDFNTILESGYCHRTRHCSWGETIQDLPLRKYRAFFRFAGERISPQMIWHPVKEDIREHIDCFPYVDTEDRLQIWDVERSRDLRAVTNMTALSALSVAGNDIEQHGRLVVDSFSAEDVKKRWTGLFAAIQRKGYWKDV